MTKAYLHKFLRSPSLYISVLGVTAVCATHFLRGDIALNSVVYQIDLFLSLDTYRKAICIFGALPFAANFAVEWNSSVTNGCITRRGVKKYAISNVVICALSSLLVVFVGMMIFCGVYSMFIPVYNSGDANMIFPPYGVFLSAGMPWLYIAAYSLVFAASCSMWAVMGMMLSAVFPNKYIAVSSPFIASYVVERISMQFPDKLNLWYLSLSRITIYNPVITVLYNAGVFASITVLCGIAFTSIVKRRVCGEIS